MTTVEPYQLHVAFFPLMAPGHTIPILDMVHLFASHHVQTTIITTPLNAPFIISNTNTNTSIEIEIFPFPSKEAGLPEGIESFQQVINSPDMNIKLLNALYFFQQPLERFLEKTRPHCLIADMFLPFATDAAAKFGIPRIVIHGTGFFADCATLVLFEHKPHLLVSSSSDDDDESFVLPNLPHEIRMVKSQLSPAMREDNVAVMQALITPFESDLKSYGVIVNSFYELEPDYADYFRKVLGRKKAWHVGPVSLESSIRRNKASIDEQHECLKWLDSREPNSVIYISFGTLCGFSASQIDEIAMALEASGQEFIWVVKKGSDEERENEAGLLDEFEKRVEGKGLIIRGWASQVLILEHEAIGGFVTHCGWNSSLEGISAGVPMVTWPVFAEQFFNEKLVTEILRIGVPVGCKEYIMFEEGSVLERGEIEAALRRVMVGEEGLEMRRRAKELKEMAWKAVEEGGSSHGDLSALIQELCSYQHHHHP